MTALYVFCALEALCLILTATRVRKLWRLVNEERPAGKQTVSEIKAAELEKAWNDGVSSILGYDLEKAKGAVRRDGEV